MMINVVRRVSLKLLQKGTSSQKEKRNRFKVVAQPAATVIVSLKNLFLLFQFYLTNIRGTLQKQIQLILNVLTLNPKKHLKRY